MSVYLFLTASRVLPNKTPANEIYTGHWGLPLRRVQHASRQAFLGCELVEILASGFSCSQAESTPSPVRMMQTVETVE
jgi:hypothetical protein